MNKETIKLIDSHQHFWDLSLNKNAWLIGEHEASFLGDYSPICYSYLPPEYLNESKDFSIEKSIHVQAGWDRSDPFGEIYWLHGIFKKYNIPSGIVAYADLTSNTIESTLEKLASLDSVKGVRQILSWHQDPYFSGCSENFLLNQILIENFALLEKYNLSFDAQIYPEQTDSFIELISKNPDASIVIDHALMPRERTSDYLQYWEKNLKKLSVYDNIFVKISGFSMFDHDLDPNITKEMVERVIDIFSPKRCMIGSNFPVDKLYHSLDYIFSIYQSAFNEYSSEEQEYLYIKTAEYFYRLNH